MTDDVRDVSLADQFDPTDPRYIDAKLMDLEQKFETLADLLKPLEDEFEKALTAHERAKAHAQLAADGKTAADREAQVLIATTGTADRLTVAKAALSYAKNQVRGWVEQKSALQSRKKGI
ncbi:hypothetical protein GS451_24010 [Rhodococcus hoagii]|nr:hypothetical protein [Prescottella equi]MBM4640675.1 hypothetical protein [Prescottella equi]NKV87457.1 hypothetical protein [Prescottella equi]NKV87976.1 hypothetical protein [Prescottella equi]